MLNYPAIFLMGPTAVGKTATAIALADRVNGEIINVDSAQVYRCMNIGTAKPSAEELARVPHHLVDFVEPEEPYSAARFCDDAARAMENIRGRGRTPILAGGTMLYFNALERGLAPLPAANPDVRKELEAEAEQEGWPAMHEKLRAVDALAADRIHPNDPQRLQRALEVYRLTGVALSEWQAQTQSALPEPVMKFALMPEHRKWLHERIELRFNRMLDEGFLDEVQSLRKRPKLHEELPSMRSVGYRQAWSYLDGDIDRNTFIESGVAATRQLAKRQMTWIRGMDNVQQLACGGNVAVQGHVSTLLAHLATD